ncbi:hypothetical protein TYRP_003803 [Tyrophagus putrescentiae]|nr:hypothetical protein TYRP_003803 [Tyrophagus putrescentiae]
MVVENSLSRSFPSNLDPDTKSNSISKSKKSSKKSSSVSAQFSYCPSGKGFAANGTVVPEQGRGVPFPSEKETPKSPAPKPPPQITTAVPFTAFVSQKPPSSFFQAPTSPANVPKKRSSKIARSPRRSAGTPKASPNANTNAKAGGTPVAAFQQQFSSPVALEESAAAPLLVNPVIRVSRFSKLAAKGTANLFSSPLFIYWNRSRQGSFPLDGQIEQKAMLVCRVANCTEHASILSANLSSHSLYVFVDH